MVMLMNVSSEQTMSSPIDSPTVGSNVQGATTEGEHNDDVQSKNPRQTVFISQEEQIPQKGEERPCEPAERQPRDEATDMVVSCSSSIDEERKQMMNVDAENAEPDPASPNFVSQPPSQVTLIYTPSSQKNFDPTRKDSLIARMRDIVEGGGQRNVDPDKQQPKQSKSSSDSLNNNNNNNNDTTTANNNNNNNNNENNTTSKASVDSAHQKRIRHSRAHHHCRHHHHHHHAHRHRPSVNGASTNVINNEESKTNPSAGSSGNQSNGIHSHHHHHHHHRHHQTGNGQHSHHRHHHHHHRHHQHGTDGEVRGTTSKRNSVQRQSVTQIESLDASNCSVNTKQTEANESSSSTSSVSTNKTHDQKLGQISIPDQENLENKCSGERNSSNSIKLTESESTTQGERKASISAGHHHYHHSHSHPHPHHHHHHHHHHHCHHRSHKKRLILDTGDNKSAAIAKSDSTNQENPSVIDDQTNLDDFKREPLQELTSQSNLSSCCSHNESNLCSAHQNQLKSATKHQHSHQSHPHPHHHHHHHHHPQHVHSSAASNQQDSVATGDDELANTAGRSHPHHHNHHHHHHRHHRHHHHHHGGQVHTHKQRQRSKQKSSSKTNIDEQAKEQGNDSVAADKQGGSSLVKQMSTDEPKTESRPNDLVQREPTISTTEVTNDRDIKQETKSSILVVGALGRNTAEVMPNDEVVRMETSPNNESRLSRAGDDFVDSTASDSNLITSIEVISAPDRQSNGMGAQPSSKGSENGSQPQAVQRNSAQIVETESGSSANKEHKENSYIKKDSFNEAYKLDRQISTHDDSKGRGDVSSRSGGSGDNSQGGYRNLGSHAVAPEISSQSRPSVTYQSPSSRPKQSAAANNSPMSQDRRCRLCWCCCCPCSALSARDGNARSEASKPSGSPPENSPLNKCPSLPNVPIEEIRSWAESFDRLMKCSDGRKVFQDFLRCEYSEENILFWTACEELKAEKDFKNIATRARDIYEDYISILSSKEVSLDSRVRDIINNNIKKPTSNIFDEAQLQIYTLMHRDSYPRFINSPMYKKLAQLPTSSRKSSS